MMIVIANVFPRLQIAKDLVRQLSKKRRFRISFGKQHAKGSQALAKSLSEIFYHAFWSLGGEITWKISPLLKFEILGTFVNTLTADKNYRFGGSGDMQFPIQMQFSLKQKSFSQFFVLFIESPSNFKHFQKENDCQS